MFARHNLVEPAGVAAPSSGGSRSYFDSVAPFWQAVYDRTDVYALIHKERRALVLSLFAQAPIPPGSRILEIGCGAGLNAVEIARRGYHVTAVDFAPQMLDLTQENARRAGVAEFIRTGQCDTRLLPFPDASFAAVMAIGVLPWLPSIRAPLTEMTRVLKPGGTMIANMDNRWRLNHVADPASWVRPAITRVAARLGLCKPYNAPPTIVCSTGAFDKELRSAGLEKLWGATLGFGPFWLINKLFPDSFGNGIHHTLQSLADRRIPVLRSAGAQYITLSRKKEAGDG